MSGEVSYVQAFAPRFRVERAADGGERVVIPARRNFFVMAFMIVWLCGWTVGGVTALSSLFVKFVPFVALWSCGWALGEAFVLASLVWMAAGKESLRVVRGDLELAAEIAGFARRRVYRGADVRDLSACAPVARNPYGRGKMDFPLLWAPSFGCVKFSYGARTIYAGVGLDEPEGRLIVDWLRPRLPKTAIAKS
jgi:hypothetical protein